MCVCVQEVKQLPVGAAPTMAFVNQSTHEIKTLVKSFELAQKTATKKSSTDGTLIGPMSKIL